MRTLCGVFLLSVVSFSSVADDIQLQSIELKDNGDFYLYKTDASTGLCDEANPYAVKVSDNQVVQSASNGMLSVSLSALHVGNDLTVDSDAYCNIKSIRIYKK